MSDESKEFWTGVYSRGARTYGRVAFFSHWGRRLVALARINSGAIVLDVAMGRGANLFPATERALDRAGGSLVLTSRSHLTPRGPWRGKLSPFLLGA